MKEHLSVQGYEILERYTVGELGFVLGENKTAPSPFVTWCYRADSPEHFFWGHYVSTRETAYEDYQKRIDDEVQDVSERTGKPPLLPALCLGIEPSSGNLINIKRGVSGYYGSDWNRPGERGHNRRTADIINERWGVTKAQEQAMLAGSIFGWEAPAADPRHYDENTLSPRAKKRDELER